MGTYNKTFVEKNLNSEEPEETENLKHLIRSSALSHPVCLVF